MRLKKLKLTCCLAAGAVMIVMSIKPATGQDATAISQDEANAAFRRVVDSSFTDCQGRKFFGLFRSLYGAGCENGAVRNKCQGVFEFRDARPVLKDVTTPADRFDKKWVGIITLEWGKDGAYRERSVTNDVWSVWEPAKNKPADADNRYLYRLWNQDGKWYRQYGDIFEKLDLYMSVNEFIENKPSCTDLLRDDSHMGESHH
jgi:hypothetical protein